jgi:hypothetical protein
MSVIDGLQKEAQAVQSAEPDAPATVLSIDMTPPNEGQ